eukprot:3201534-Ditylum_brightwellii.AAC.1
MEITLAWENDETIKDMKGYKSVSGNKVKTALKCVTGIIFKKDLRNPYHCILPHISNLELKTRGLVEDN